VPNRFLAASTLRVAFDVITIGVAVVGVAFTISANDGVPAAIAIISVDILAPPLSCVYSVFYIVWDSVRGAREERGCIILGRSTEQEGDEVDLEGAEIDPRIGEVDRARGEAERERS
jgi:hypothetical protein